MTKIDLISKEILLIIFSNIESVNDVARCRLVCKAWNTPAEETMFSRQITLTSDAKSLVFHAHLFKNPSKGKLVKHLHLHTAYNKKSMVILRAILKLAFTPNIERLTGNVTEEEFYTAIADIANESPAEFGKLKSIPSQLNTVTLAYCNALLSFKHSLTTIIFFARPSIFPDNMLWNFTVRLVEFKCLSFFSFTGCHRHFSDLEKMLNGCQQIKSLLLNTVIIERLEERQFDTWVRTAVVKVPKLTKLVINADNFRGDQVEYLIYKYSHIKDISIYSEPSIQSPNEIAVFKNNINQVFAAIKKIPTKTISFKINHNLYFVDIIKHLQTKCTIETIRALDDNRLFLKLGGL